jgi:hypothetical protein
MPNASQALDANLKPIIPAPIQGDVSPIQIASATASARIAVLPNRLIQVKATVNCYYKLGDVTVAAAATTSATDGSQYLAAGTCETVITPNIAAPYLAAIRAATTDGQITISYLKG